MRENNTDTSVIKELLQRGGARAAWVLTGTTSTCTQGHVTQGSRKLLINLQHIGTRHSFLRGRKLGGHFLWLLKEEVEAEVEAEVEEEVEAESRLAAELSDAASVSAKEAEILQKDG